MNGATRRSIVPTSFGQVHARRTGAGEGTPLVLLHMSPRSGQMYERLQAALPRPTIALDRLGYGFSDPPSRPLSLSEYAGSALEALDALGVTGRFDVLGMHTGSLEAIEIARLAPARVRHLAIVAIPIFDAEGRRRGLETFARMQVVPVEDGSHLLPAWQGRFAYRTPPYDLADVQRRFVDYLLAPHPGQAYGAVFAEDFAPKLRELGRPVVAFVPHDDVHELSVRSRDLLPAGSRYLDLPGFDIDFLRTRTAEFARLLDEHLPVRS